MTLIKSLANFLEKNKVKHEVIPHRRVFTAYDKAATLHVDSKMVVKTAVFQVGSGKETRYPHSKIPGIFSPVLVLVPASKHIDKKKVKTAVNVWLRKQSRKPEARVDFATEQWMKKNLSGDIGATPTFPQVLGMYVFVDNALLKQSKMYLNVGSYGKSILVNQANFRKILGEDFMKGSFSQAK